MGLVDYQKTIRLASLVKLHFTATNVHLRLLLTFNQPPSFLLSLKKRKNKQEQEEEKEEEIVPTDY